MPLRSNPKSFLLWSLLLNSLVSALQQHSPDAHPRQARFDELRADEDGHGHGHGSTSVAERRWPASANNNNNNNVGGAVPTPLSGQRGHRDTRVDDAQHSFLNERALATLSPAQADPEAVRAPLAHWSSAGSAAGSSSRQTGRSLQDWQVEDIMLLATVDGKLHARDRRTGAPLWQLETNSSMVETTYHPAKKVGNDDDGGGSMSEDPLWIVEPSQDGGIYMFLPGSGVGVQKLDYTVKQLMDLTPFESPTDPPVTYTAEKKTALYTVDASTGSFLKGADSSGTTTNEDNSCRRVSYLEPLEEEECEPIGKLTIGRTEYTISISSGGRQLTTIRYSEWGFNNRDQDLRRNYTATTDSKYVYSKHNGTVFGVELSSNGKFGAETVRKPIYKQNLGSPVVRVFDIFRPIGNMSSNVALLILPQPVAPYHSHLPRAFESIFVDCTESGSWYALSETKYPGVTHGTAMAGMYNHEMFKLGLPSMPWPPSTQERGQFTGVHHIAPLDVTSEPLIDAPNWPGIDPPPSPREVPSQAVLVTESRLDKTVPLRTILIASLAALVILGAGGAAYRAKLNTKAVINLPAPVKASEETLVEQVPEPVASVSVERAVVDEREPEVKLIEPEKEIIFPHEALTPPEEAWEVVGDAEAPKVDEAVELVQVDSVESQAEKPEKLGPEANEPKKKKGAHRGKRGGRKAKEKELQQAAARAEKVEQKEAKPAESADAPIVVRFEKGGQLLTPPSSSSEMDTAKVVGVLQINSLIIHTDRVIGQGSCGTSVFEGSFEGRAVAVKRMLSQYYELASQEVSFLQQSDDHPNVIRYFCQQRDDHFLYIAVELCQASLFEVWEPEKARTEERQKQLQTLKFTIQQDVPKALQQLAAGLYHLHNLRIIHRDIKPQNILVAFPKKNQTNGPQLVISDFGLGKNLPENVSTLVDPTGNAGTSGWKAPELISQPRETDSRHSQSNSHTGVSENAVPGNGTSGVKRAADIFSLGCLFFWVLTDGIHPYEDENGWHQLRELNIKRDNKKMEVLERWSDAYEPMQLITSMLAHQPEHRPTALQVLNHPFFWTPTKRLAFLCDCSDHFEREPRGIWEDGYAGDSYDLNTLESRAEEVIGAPFEKADFLAKLDRLFVDTLGRQRKYSGNRLLDLLRALRNKKNHYEDMADDVKRRVGPLPDGYLNTWCHRFPRLLMACYEVVYECGLDKSDRFKGYFDAGA